MLPLEPLEASSPIARLLAGAPADDVRAEIDRLAAPAAAGGADAGALSFAPAALSFARGALALREGDLDAAAEHLESAAGAYDRLGEADARDLARCDALLAGLRRGPRAAIPALVASLDAVAGARSGAPDRVWVVATHYRGAAERLLGDAAAAQRTLLAALGRSEPFLAERAQILNSLGTLYVVLGAFGAAEALLEHAAELHLRRGDAVGEAIAWGQLGAAALGLGELERARTCLQRQEWLASQVGDAFGRARALTFLADLALDLGRPDDAAALAISARAVAEASSPPLRVWVAYAARALGRARRALGDPGATAALDEAAALFAAIGNPLGHALAAWDRAAAVALAGGDPDGAGFFSAAWALGSLGLPARVTALLRERRDLAPALAATAAAAATAERALAAAAQTAPRLAAQHEVELVYDRPDDLAAIAARRTAAHRNLGRLAALTIAPPGLIAAAIAAQPAGADLGSASDPPARASVDRASVDRASVDRAACIADLPGLSLWVWPAATPLEAVAADLAALRAAHGAGARAALALAATGRVRCPPFAGAVGAELEGVDAAALIAVALALAPAALRLDPGLAWDDGAEARASAAGFATQR